MDRRGLLLHLVDALRQPDGLQRRFDLGQRPVGGDAHGHVDGLDLEELGHFDVLLVGVPTWDVGELQESWYYAAEGLEQLDLSGTQVAFFGEGDQSGYPHNFQDALGTSQNFSRVRRAKRTGIFDVF